LPRGQQTGGRGECHAGDRADKIRRKCIDMTAVECRRSIP